MSVINVVSEPELDCGEPLSLATLPPFLRVLVVTDGTVTSSLAAYYGEPIDVKVLSHAEERSDRSYPLIDVARGDAIIRRRVTLQGGNTRAIYAFAESIIVINRLTESLRRTLLEQRKGIGELLREQKLESYRDLRTVRRALAGAWSPHLAVARGTRVIVRDYAIHLGGRAAIAIEEVFPESAFEAAS